MKPPIQEAPASTSPHSLDEFIAQQRDRLLALREEMQVSIRAQEAEESALGASATGELAEFGDDAQRLSTLETEGNWVSDRLRRLQEIDRALEKISQGTYGLSDASGQPLSLARLKAVPEAIYTLEESQAMYRSKRR